MHIIEPLLPDNDSFDEKEPFIQPRGRRNDALLVALWILTVVLASLGTFIITSRAQGSSTESFATGFATELSESRVSRIGGVAY